MIINKKPTTVGGNTNGKRKAVSTMLFPLNFRFAITFPKNNPRIKTNTPATDAISTDRLTGDQKFVAILITVGL
jgi:hypothetical protein